MTTLRARLVRIGARIVRHGLGKTSFSTLKKDSDASRRIGTYGFKEIPDISFMNCLHPELYNRKTAEPPPIKPIDDVETEGTSLTRDESGGCPDCCPDGIRHEGGLTLSRALFKSYIRDLLPSQACDNASPF
jgi:hypothetical protein